MLSEPVKHAATHIPRWQREWFGVRHNNQRVCVLPISLNALSYIVVRELSSSAQQSPRERQSLCPCCGSHGQLLLFARL